MKKIKLGLSILMLCASVNGCEGLGERNSGDGQGVNIDRSLPEFTFTAIPDKNKKQLRKRFGPVSRYLENNLGVPVKYVPVESYTAALTEFSNNQVQLAWFGGFAGLQARARVPGSQAIAQGIEDKAFSTYFIANTATGLVKSASFPRNIMGKTFVFGARGSTSGRLMPEYYIRHEFGEAPEEVFERVAYSGSHSRTIEMVQSGAYQVGVLNTRVWDSERANIDPEKVKVIWQTPPYSDYQWTIRGDVDKTWGKGFQAKVTKALLAMEAPELLQAFPRSQFIPATNEDYEPIRETGEAIGLLDR